MKPFRIGKRWIGLNGPCFIVAEVGINHNGSVQQAKELIDGAKYANADAVKFQVFTSASRPSLSRYRLLEMEYRACKAYATSVGLIWFATPFDVESVKLLQRVGVPCYKISHDNAGNVLLLQAASATTKPLIISIYDTPFPVDIVLEDVRKCCLHCVGIYPTPWNKTDLEALTTDYVEGYSSHTAGIEDCVAARALGAVIIEKHLKLEDTEPIDSAVSITPSRFKEMVKMIRNVEAGLS